MERLIDSTPQAVLAAVAYSHAKLAAYTWSQQSLPATRHSSLSVQRVGLSTTALESAAALAS